MMRHVTVAIIALSLGEPRDGPGAAGPVRLWPTGAPGSRGRTADELVRPTELGEHIVSRVHRPSITPYLPEVVMAEPKTQRSGKSVSAFLKAIPDASQRRDAQAVARLVQEVVEEKPEMWGDAIVGFGTYAVRYADGRQSDWPLVGLSPRKQSLTLYLGGLKSQGALLKKLGKHKIGGGCLHIGSLADVDLPTLKTLIRESVAQRKKAGA
jgi:hypothetical protein